MEGKQVFEWEKSLVGKGHVLCVCDWCGSEGVAMPLNRTCPDCGKVELIAYYDAGTINQLIESLKSNP